MFEVRKSIKRFRDDPAWTYRDKAPDYLATFDRGGYPFSLGPQGNGIHDLLQGSLHGREVSLFHLNAWKRSGGSNQAQVAWKFSVAVLTLPRVLPATAFTCGRLNGHTGNWKLPAIPRTAGPSTELPNSGAGGVRRCSTDPGFAALVDTPETERLTREALIGWRTDGDRIIGWTFGRRTYEEIHSVAETLVAIIAAFPEQAWHWPEGTRG
ncbi:hypothetical protein [Actinacidiphila oryziradicis]|uniref:Uncharacterized protein n=1 Tax=Actinacidiphila oryziradicis TaxID=2571141 RepID=A0A4U0RRZ3_9ACTN|nr:hypothetical protein [Actinacidiphila oryziradicis]TJZ98831.1 hypothetical protein FCI23_48060 [Actinacidiphila oryziradicis]